MSQERIIRDFVALTSDRRNEIDGLRWRSSAMHGAGQMMDGTQLAGRSDISPARVVQRWKLVRCRVFELSPWRAPRQLDSGDVDMSFEDRFSQMLRYSGLPLYFRPFAATHEHRCVASGGNAHSIELCVLSSEEGSCSISWLSPHDMRLFEYPEKGGAARGAVRPGLELLLVANLGRVTEVYGDFGLALAMFEAGSLQAQLLTIGSHLGFRIRTMMRGDVSEASSRMPDRCWSRLPLAGVAFERHHAGPRLSEIPSVCHIPFDDHNDLERRVLLRAVVNELRRSFEKGKVSAPDRCDDFYVPFPKTAPFTDTLRRSSGDPGCRPLRRGLSIDVLADLFRSVVSSELGMRAPDEFDDLALLICVRNSDGSPRACCVAPNQGLQELPLTVSASRAAEETMPSDGCATITIHASDEYASAGDPARLLDAYLQSGRLAQLLGLQAASHGAFARPQKAYPDAMVNALLPIDRRALLQIQLGFLDPAHLQFGLQ